MTCVWPTEVLSDVEHGMAYLLDPEAASSMTGTDTATLTAAVSTNDSGFLGSLSVFSVIGIGIVGCLCVGGGVYLIHTNCRR